MLSARRISSLCFAIFIMLLFSGCDRQKDIVSHVSEKEANIILVLLESKKIPAHKTLAQSTTIGGDGGGPKYTISVRDKDAIDAIAYLNQNGFPKSQGTTLLELFAKQGLMSSDKEEAVRYQSGLAQQITNTILMMDGVIDANVQISFPSQDTSLFYEIEKEKKITAAVYVKHQGVIDDPNVHLANKIKRLVSGSVSGLNIDDVTVITDRSRFTDISLDPAMETIGMKPKEYISVWNIVMSKDSVGKFRLIFFFLITLSLLLFFLLGWIGWKCYPHIKASGGLKSLFGPSPLIATKSDEEQKKSQDKEKED